MNHCSTKDAKSKYRMAASRQWNSAVGSQGMSLRDNYPQKLMMRCATMGCFHVCKRHWEQIIRRSTEILFALKRTQASWIKNKSIILFSQVGKKNKAFTLVLQNYYINRDIWHSVYSQEILHELFYTVMITLTSTLLLTLCCTLQNSKGNI